jgi:hypothetical protein
MMTPEKVTYIRTLEDGDGRIDIDELIAEAKSPDNVCHEDFEWDTDKGMLMLWRQQARELIRQVHVETRVVSGVAKVPYYVADPEYRHDHSRYMTLLSARDSRGRATAVMLDEMRRVLSAIQRASAVASVLGSGVAGTLDEIVKSVTLLKASVESSIKAPEEKGRKSRGSATARPKAHASRRRRVAAPASA